MEHLVLLSPMKKKSINHPAVATIVSTCTCGLIHQAVEIENRVTHLLHHKKGAGFVFWPCVHV